MTMNEKLIFTNKTGEELDRFIGDLGNPRTIIITDNNVEAEVFPALGPAS